MIQEKDFIDALDSPGFTFTSKPIEVEEFKQLIRDLTCIPGVRYEVESEGGSYMKSNTFWFDGGRIYFRSSGYHPGNEHPFVTLCGEVIDWEDDVLYEFRN
ncbi:MAG: hypothetical protein AAB557_04270 [Patescibacteria group bacterium]